MSRQRSGDYRIFVGAFPNGELADRIQAVRQQYDPKTACIAAPHVTLAMRLSRDDTGAMVRELKQSEKPWPQARVFHREWEHGRYAAPIHELRLMQRGPGDPVWRSIARIPLLSASEQ